ncbi:MAG: hypothetical protein M1822_009569 [Bathelium mastoideum]|nr:MAG: hypothetical protein M1822_009569 [Bathelium mastoideum]
MVQIRFAAPYVLPANAKSIAASPATERSWRLVKFGPPTTSFFSDGCTQRVTDKFFMEDPSDSPPFVRRLTTGLGDTNTYIRPNRHDQRGFVSADPQPPICRWTEGLTTASSDIMPAVTQLETFSNHAESDIRTRASTPSSNTLLITDPQVLSALVRTQADIEASFDAPLLDIDIAHAQGASATTTVPCLHENGATLATPPVLLSKASEDTDESCIALSDSGSEYKAPSASGTSGSSSAFGDYGSDERGAALLLGLNGLKLVEDPSAESHYESLELEADVAGPACVTQANSPLVNDKHTLRQSRTCDQSTNLNEEWDAPDKLRHPKVIIPRQSKRTHDQFVEHTECWNYPNKHPKVVIPRQSKRTRGQFMEYEEYAP